MYIYTRHINPLSLRTQYKKKPLQLIHMTMLFIFMTPFFVCCLVFLIIKEKTWGRWADIYLGGCLPTSSIHHQGEQEEVKERQGPEQSFIILNAKRKGVGGEEKIQIL